MKKIIALAVVTFMTISLFAQEIKETNVTLNNLNFPAYTLSLQKDKKMVQEYLERRLKEAKLKTKKEDGFETSWGVVFSEIAPTPINFHYKVEGNSKSATVTVFAISTDLSINQSNINQGVFNFLKNFTQYVNKAEAADKLEDAESVLKKAVKTQASAAADIAKLEKSTEKNRSKIADLQKDIEKWKKNIAEAEKDIKELNADIEKRTKGKLTDAQKRLQEADKAVGEAQAVVERLRQQAQ